MKGHIYRRDGGYTYVIDLGKNPITNKRQQKSKGGFKTKREAQSSLAKALTEYNEGYYINETEITLKQFVEQWLKLYEETGNVKISTVRVRKHESNNMIKYFKDIKLKDINSKMYQGFLLDLNNHFSYNTLSGIHGTARMVFRKAIELRYIKRDPTEFAKLPKKQLTVEDLENEEEIPMFFEKEELSDFLNICKEDNNPQTYVIFMTLAYTGMRVGELCALKWKDISFKNKEISIYKTYYNPTNNAPKYTLLTPKTQSSKRKIFIDDILIKELKKHKSYQNSLILKIPSWYKEDFVFTKILKHQGYPETVKQIGLKMKQLTDTGLTPHSLRHTHASLLAQAGIGLEEIMDRLGHKDDYITRNIYLHITKDMKKEASQKFSELMKSF